MTNRALDATLWLLIYAGLAGVVIGLVLHRVHAGLGWILGGVGVVAVAAGIGLFRHRARRGGADPGSRIPVPKPRERQP